MASYTTGNKYCNHCNGSGRRWLIFKCPYCNGKGYVWGTFKDDQI